MPLESDVGKAKRYEINTDNIAFLMLKECVLHQSINGRLLAIERLKSISYACNANVDFYEIVFDAGHSYLLLNDFLLKGRVVGS